MLKHRNTVAFTLNQHSFRGSKKATACRGVVLFEDEASFWLDGTLHRTWAGVGCQPRVDTYGLRKTAHLFATIALHDADFSYWFADVFNGHTFWTFLKRLVAKYRGRKIFLIIDNAPAIAFRRREKSGSPKTGIPSSCIGCRRTLRSSIPWSQYGR